MKHIASAAVAAVLIWAGVAVVQVLLALSEGAAALLEIIAQALVKEQ